MRILVIQTAFIGDVVLTTPFLEALRSQFPTAELHVVATPQGCEMLAGLQGVVCHSLDKKRDKLVRGLKRTLSSLGKNSHFDCVFAVHRSLRTLALAKKVKAARRVAFRSFWSRFFRFETVQYPAYATDMHYADRPLALLAKLGKVPATPQPRLVSLPADRARIQEKLARIGARSGAYLVLSPFSAWGTKMWFADRFARVGLEISKKFGLPIVVVGSHSSSEMLIAQTTVEKITAGGGRALSLVGQTSIGELKALIEGAKLVLANDSAPVHIASAFQVPVVAIFGPTVKKWGFFPLSKSAIVVEREGVGCRPCSLHGPNKCPLGHFRCMNEILVEDVTQAVESLLERSFR